MGTPPEISSAASSADENEDEKSRFIRRRGAFFCGKSSIDLRNEEDEKKHVDGLFI